MARQPGARQVMQDLLLFPCNGNAVEALDCINGFRVVGFVDDDDRKRGRTVYGLPVFGRAAFSAYPSARVLAVPGSAESFARRADIIESLGVPRQRFATVIHPKTVVSRNARIGSNVLIMAGTVVTANAVIEDHAVILPNCVIHHDSTIGTYSILGAAVLVTGFVHIGRNCYVGAGSRLRDHIDVAPGTFLGLGSVVTRSIEEPHGVWVGNPARFLHPTVPA